MNKNAPTKSCFPMDWHESSPPTRKLSSTKLSATQVAMLWWWQILPDGKGQYLFWGINSWQGTNWNVRSPTDLRQDVNMTEVHLFGRCLLRNPRFWSNRRKPETVWNNLNNFSAFLFRYGRRWPLFIFHMVAAVVLFTNVWLPKETGVYFRSSPA